MQKEALSAWGLEDDADWLEINIYGNAPISTWSEDGLKKLVARMAENIGESVDRFSVKPGLAKDGITKPPRLLAEGGAAARLLAAYSDGLELTQGAEAYQATFELRDDNQPGRKKQEDEIITVT